MRFHADGPAIPDILLERCDSGRVVFLCGAGVSLSSGMPSFVDLTKYVIEFFDPPEDSEIIEAFQPWDTNQSAANVPLDQIFNLLHQEYGKDEVNALVTKRLSLSIESNEIGHEHGLIKRISSNQSGVPQIVTTNFDLLFEAGPDGEMLVYHVPPAFPDLSFGSTLEGVTYLHGRLVETSSQHHPYVLSSADFGRAYLSEGWATNFVRKLLESYTVVLVGYQAEDPPIKYLLQGLNHDGQYDRSRLYAFDKGPPEKIEAKWNDRGVTAIAYSDHRHLWETMEAWANRADDPRGWRGSIITKSQQDPKGLTPHERGQVAHILRTVQGARLFSELDPVPHPEWVCVMDTGVRSLEPSNWYDYDEEPFDPRAEYGLDDDLNEITEEEREQGISNDNLLVWRDGDDNPDEFHRLDWRHAQGFEAAPIRLDHLITWISNSIDSPTLAWWAARQNRLHPRLLQRISSQINGAENLHVRARHIWSVILEHHQDSRNTKQNVDWFKFQKRVSLDGWTASVLREFRRITMPRVVISLSLGLRGVKPPSLPWEDINFSHIGQFDVKIIERQGTKLELPDEILPQVFKIIEESLEIASGLLTDIETVYFPTPTCYRKREIDGKQYITEETDCMLWFVELIDRMAILFPEQLNARVKIWRSNDQFFFRKLKLYAFSKIEAFEANHAAEEILALDQESFWDSKVVRELLFLLVDRWEEISRTNRYQLTDRILAGPDQLSFWPDEDYPALRDELAARYARYLELKDCGITGNRRERIATMVAAIHEWSDDWATSIVTEHGSRSDFIGVDETPEAVMHIPVKDVVSTAEKDLKSDFGGLTEKRPFTGLVKINPRKALAALTIEGKAGNYPRALWSSMINDLSEDISTRLRTVFLHRLARLPDEVVIQLRHPLGQWLKQNLSMVLEFNDELGWIVFDHIVDVFLTGGPNAAESGIGQYRQGGRVIEQSRRTYLHAYTGPIGMCCEALFSAVPGEQQDAASLIPIKIKSRVERLLAAPGEGADHAVSITMRKLSWLMYVDPEWTQNLLIPMLSFDHPFSEPAWNGFLHSRRAPQPALTKIIKPLLLHLFPWIEEQSWKRDLSEIAAWWLGSMRVFRPDKPDGLTRKEMRSALCAMSDDTRCQFIFSLGRLGKENTDGWIRYVIPFIKEDWPRERRFRTFASTKAWIGLLDDTGSSFPAVYEAVKSFLIPLDTNEHLYYRFTREINNVQSLSEQFPETTLDLMSRVTPSYSARLPYELPMVLAVIAESDPSLISDSRYVRLIDFVERS